ncbi:MAG: DNA alkylation repair protein [Reichenbachiella sp.]
MEPLKNEFSEAFVSDLGKHLVSLDSSFDQKRFIGAVINDQWEGRELKDRMRHISLMIQQHTAMDYLDQLEVMKNIAPQYGGLKAMVFPDYVEVHGLDHVDESLKALKYVTRFSSSEFAIRPFIIKEEKQVMELMLEWSQDENEHVRRFATEGCRPRLPWAMALPTFKNDPSLVIPILENLKNDDSLYVRKSVANNINDITKDNTDIALEICQRWYGRTEHTNWIVKHGLRNLLKRGDETALEIIGFNKNAKFTSSNLELNPSSLSIGDDLKISFDVMNEEASSSLVKIGYQVDYMKSNGSHSGKIFHVTEKEVGARQSIAFNKKLSMKNLSTRKHYPGVHHVKILANGIIINEESFELGV